MKKIVLGLIAALVFIGCSSDTKVDVNVEPALVVGKSLADFKLNDQFEAPHALSTKTTKLIFAFSKDMAHTCNDYFVTKEDTYLSDHNTQFVADVSAAPSIIRNMFILPGLKDFKHTVLLLDKKEVAAPFKANIDAEKIIVVYIKGMTISQIETISTKEELIAAIESK